MMETAGGGFLEPKALTYLNLSKRILSKTRPVEKKKKKKAGNSRVKKTRRKGLLKRRKKRKKSLIIKSKEDP